MLETLGFVLEVEWLTQAALLMLVLNLFNLLPFMPLDGGWVAHITLFSRSKYLDIGFRAVTILVMLAATVLLQDRILLFLGIAMLVGLPAVWRSLKVQELLSREALPPPVADQIPAEAICRIAQVCQEAKMPAVNLSGLAAMTINVYEAVMARPTSWIATLGLWALHGGAIGLGLVGLIGFVFASYASRFRELADLDFEVMQIEVPGEQREFNIGPGALPKPALLMWQFADEEQAAKAFASLKDSADGSTSRWGQTILASGSSDAAMDADADVETLTDMFSLPSKQELAARNSPQLNVLDRPFSPVQKRLFEQLPQMEVTFGSAEKQAQTLKRLNELPQLDVEQQPLTEWSLGRKPTASQQRLRRLLNVLLERVDELPWVAPAVADQRPPEDAEPQNFDNMTSEEIDEFIEKEEQAMETRRAELRKLKLAWINAGLQRSKGDTKQMIESYLRYESDWHSFEQRQQESDFDIDVPRVEDYLATSLEALGYVDASAPEYRFGVNLFGYTLYDDEAFLDSEAGVEETEEPVTEFGLSIDISSCIDSVATLSSLVDWLFEQGATAVRLSYEQVVLPEELVAVE